MSRIVAGIRVVRALAWFIPAVYAADCAATVQGYPAVDIRDQIRRADHVLHATIIERQRMGSGDPDVPVDSCGVRYRLRIVEEFKGELGSTIWFATHGILFVDRPLSPGDHVLLFLRDLEKKGPADDIVRRNESKQAYARIRTCGDPQTTLYLAPYEENIFPIVREDPRSSTSALWMHYSIATIIPADIVPRRPERCEPLKGGGCLLVEQARAAWEPLRNALRTWARRTN